jgi:hypothetical protein
MPDESQPAAVLTPAQKIKADNDALLAELDAELAQLTPEARKEYFFVNRDARAVKLVNLLSSRVDAICDPAKRKEFFLSHPELEVRYSAANFTK